MTPWQASSDEADYGEQPWETPLYADEDEEDNDVEESEEYYSEEKLLPTKILM